MLELIISDDLTPSLECPRCSRLCVHCSLPIPDEGPKCPGCGGSFRLPELLPGKDRTDPVPPGVSVVDQGSNWSISVSTRVLKKAIISLVSSAVLLTGTVLVWIYIGNPFGAGDSDTEGLRRLGLLLLAGSLGLLGNAAWQLWGRYAVSVSGDAGTVFQGVGGIGGKRRFSLPVINGVSLTKALITDSRGNTIEKRVIRLEGVDFYMDLGERLPDEQRAYLALFLLQKRLEFGRSTRAATV